MVQHETKVSGNNMNNIRHETSRHVRNEERECRKGNLMIFKRNVNNNEISIEEEINVIGLINLDRPPFSCEVNAKLLQIEGATWSV
jgi:hypothetical protein